MSNQSLNKARELLIQKYIESLKQKQLPWEQGWELDIPRNGITNTKYNGVNALLLSFIAFERNYSGNRWCTFNQIADKDNKYHPNQKWHLKKDSKSVPIEFWFVYNIKDKQKYTFEEYEKIVKSQPEREEEFRLTSKIYYVFNEDCIEGMEKEKAVKYDINSEKIIENIINNINVKYIEKGTNAYYSPIDDTVVVPPKELFKNQYSYYSTQLHELCHSTGHSSRLNRDLNNKFGSKEYAKEELRAEISSSFLMQELNLEYDENHIMNHIAYVQSWIDILEEKPNELFKAIKDSNKIVEYIKENSELEKLRELEENKNEQVEEIIEIYTEEPEDEEDFEM